MAVKLPHREIPREAEGRMIFTSGRRPRHRVHGFFGACKTRRRRSSGVPCLMNLVSLWSSWDEGHDCMPVRCRIRIRAEQAICREEHAGEQRDGSHVP